MSPLLIILLVMFVVIMLLWFLTLVGASNVVGTNASPWLAFIACLLLGIVVFLVVR